MMLRHSRIPESRARMLGRVTALAAGLLVLYGAAEPTIGFVLVAPLGVWIVYRIQRARGRTLGLGDSWLGAVGGVTLAFVLVAAVVALRLPSGTLTQLRHVADSASAQSAKQPPPAWLSRIAPQSAARASAVNTQPPAALTTFFLVWGMGMLVGLLGGLAGTVGWVGTILLVFWASGDWPRGAPKVVFNSVD